MTKINLKVIKNPDEKFRVVRDDLVDMKVSRDFTIRLENGDDIIVNRYQYCGNEDESDYDIISGNAIYNKMSEEDQDAFYDFVQELRVIK